MRTVLMLCGGRSAEHEVSIISARNVLAALDKTQFHACVIVVSRTGNWCYLEDNAELSKLTACDDVLPGSEIVTLIRRQNHIYLINESRIKQQIDVVFPLLHGPMGEDGTIQGMCEVLGLPYVGCGVLTSAVCMDKAFTKKLLESAGLPIAPYVVLYESEILPSYEELCTKLASDTLFVKPAVMGSSVGISKVRNTTEWKTAAVRAFTYGRKIIVEPHIEGREIECAVLGNDQPEASALGEIRPSHEFYSYEAKYLDPEGAALIVPAEMPLALTEQGQKLAIDTFRVLGCCGMARVDLFLTPSMELIVNEVNTIPGFTSISMYPRLWQYSGMAYTDLITRLLELAYEEYAIRERVSVIRD